MSEERSAAGARPRVIVAGSGVGAVEAVLALRAVAGQVAIEIDLVAREDHFVYRPLAVVEPFGYPPPYRLPLDRLERTHGVRHLRDAIARVDADAHRVALAGGGELEFDALVIATGAVAEQWLPGGLAFWASEDVEAYRALLAELEAGTVSHVLFAVPPGASWTLPLYELALLTTAWIADHGVIGAELTLATPHREPLPLFRPSAARVVRDLFGARGIHLLTETQVTSVCHEGATLSDRSPVPADRVVTLPRLVGNPPPGLPADRDRFVPIDEHGAVAGLRDVYAVGDVTAFPVKQGSVAAQQAGRRRGGDRRRPRRSRRAGAVRADRRRGAADRRHGQVPARRPLPIRDRDPNGRSTSVVVAAGEDRRATPCVLPRRTARPGADI